MKQRIIFQFVFVFVSREKKKKKKKFDSLVPQVVCSR